MSALTFARILKIFSENVELKGVVHVAVSDALKE